MTGFTASASPRAGSEEPLGELEAQTEGSCRGQAAQQYFLIPGSVRKSLDCLFDWAPAACYRSSDRVRSLWLAHSCHPGPRWSEQAPKRARELVHMNLDLTRSALRWLRYLLSNSQSRGVRLTVVHGPSKKKTLRNVNIQALWKHEKQPKRMTPLILKTVRYLLDYCFCSSWMMYWENGCKRHKGTVWALYLCPNSRVILCILQYITLFINK